MQLQQALLLQIHVQIHSPVAAIATDTFAVQLQIQIQPQ